MARRSSARTASLLGLLALTAVLYAPSLAHGYQYEDANWLPRLEQPLEWRVPSRDLSVATHAVVGLHPRMDHAINVALHLLNGFLVWLVARHVVTTAAAYIATSVFLLHPLNSAAVNYLSARTDLLMTAWILLAVWACVGAAVWWRYALIGLALIGAATSKEIGAIGLVLVALTAFVFRAPMRAWMGWASLVGVCAALGKAWGWLFLLPHVGGASVPWHEWLGLQLAMCWHLLTLIVWPVGFSIDHDALAATPRAIALAVVLSLQVLALIALAWRSRPVGAWGLAFAALSVAPRFVFRTSEFLTEPQLYLSSVGISVLAGVSLAACWTWTPMRLQERTV